MKKIGTSFVKKEYIRRHILALYTLFHTVIFVGLWICLAFHTCKDSLFIGSCGLGKRFITVLLFFSWILFSFVFSRLFISTHNTNNNSLFVTYIGSIVVTIGMLIVLVTSGGAIILASYIP